MSMENAMNPAWVQYGAMGLLFFLFALVGMKILPEHRKSQEKQADTFAQALRDVEEKHNEDTKRVIDSHHQTIQMVVGEQDRRYELMSTISKNTEETSKTLAAQTEILRQLMRNPSARTRMTDSQRRNVTDAEKAAFDAARKVMES